MKPFIICFLIIFCVLIGTTAIATEPTHFCFLCGKQVDTPDYFKGMKDIPLCDKCAWEYTGISLEEKITKVINERIGALEEMLKANQKYREHLKKELIIHLNDRKGVGI